MRLPRWYHRARAAMTGHSWTPCPSCGEHFGGHEWLADREAERGGHIATIWDPVKQQGKGICPACTLKGVGCLSHVQVGRVHAGCPYVLGRDVVPREES